MRGHVRRRCPAPKPGQPACGSNCGHPWAYVLELPRGEDGRRRQTWKSGFRTKREAEAALTLALVDAERQPTSQTTVRAYLEDWVRHLDRKPATLATYQRIIEQRVVPLLGHLRLTALSAEDLRRAYAKWMSGGLSPSSVQLIHQVLNKAFGDAERTGLLLQSPTRVVDAPRKTHHELQTWSRDQVVAFLEHTRGDRLSAMWRLFLTTGMRRGEVAALRWSDVDLDGAHLSVRQTGNVINRQWVVGTPKGRGRGATRRLSLDAVTVAALRQHRERQLLERLFAAEVWQDSGLVFCREDGSPLNPTRIGHRLADHAKKAGLPHVRVHDLRHTYATLALLAGVHPKVVSERLGHSNIGITLNLYSHVTAGMDRDAADLIASLLDQ